MADLAANAAQQQQQPQTQPLVPHLMAGGSPRRVIVIRPSLAPSAAARAPALTPGGQQFPATTPATGPAVVRLTPSVPRALERIAQATEGARSGPLPIPRPNDGFDSLSRMLKKPETFDPKKHDVVQWANYVKAYLHLSKQATDKWACLAYMFLGDKERAMIAGSFTEEALLADVVSFDQLKSALVNTYQTRPPQETMRDNLEALKGKARPTRMAQYKTEFVRIASDYVDARYQLGGIEGVRIIRESIVSSGYGRLDESIRQDEAAGSVPEIFMDWGELLAYCVRFDVKATPADYKAALQSTGRGSQPQLGGGRNKREREHGGRQPQAPRPSKEPRKDQRPAPPGCPGGNLFGKLKTTPGLEAWLREHKYCLVCREPGMLIEHAGSACPVVQQREQRERQKNHRR